MIKLLLITFGVSQICLCEAFHIKQNLSIPKESRNAFWRHHSRPSTGIQQTRGIRLLAFPGIDSVGDLWTSYNDALEASPLVVKSLTAGVILGSADLAGQVLENKNAQDESELQIDYGRFIRFCIFGLVLQAPWNHFYYQILDGVLPPTEDPFTATTAIKVVIDQFIQAPIFTILIFVFLGTLEGKSLDSIKKQLDDDYVNTMLANCK